MRDWQDQCVWSKLNQIRCSSSRPQSKRRKKRAILKESCQTRQIYQTIDYSNNNSSMQSIWTPHCNYWTTSLIWDGAMMNMNSLLLLNMRKCQQPLLVTYLIDGRWSDWLIEALFCIHSDTGIQGTSSGHVLLVIVIPNISCGSVAQNYHEWSYRTPDYNMEYIMYGHKYLLCIVPNLVHGNKFLPKWAALLTTCIYWANYHDVFLCCTQWWGLLPVNFTVAEFNYWSVTSAFSLPITALL